MVGAPEFKMLQMPNQHGLISDRPGCRPPLKLGILKGDKYVGSLPSTNVARNMKYLNFLICAGGENFDCFQTIGDKTHQPNPTVDIRLPYWKVGPNPFPKQHDFRPWGTVAGANGPCSQIGFVAWCPTSCCTTCPKGKSRRFFEASHLLWDFSKFGNFEPSFFAETVGMTTSECPGALSR